MRFECVEWLVAVATTAQEQLHHLLRRWQIGLGRMLQPSPSPHLSPTAQHPSSGRSEMYLAYTYLFHTPGRQSCRDGVAVTSCVKRNTRRMATGTMSASVCFRSYSSLSRPEGYAFQPCFCWYNTTCNTAKQSVLNGVLLKKTSQREKKDDVAED